MGPALGVQGRGEKNVVEHVLVHVEVLKGQDEEVSGVVLATATSSAIAVSTR